MALGDSYAEVEEFKQNIKISSPALDAQIADSLALASREIEQRTSRQFNKVDTPSAKLYEIHNSSTLLVDDFHTTDGLVITVGDRTLTTADYVLEPFNGPHGWPFYRIRARGSFRFPTYYGADLVEVTAAWGWAAVPVEIKQACLALANENLKLVREAVFGVTGTNSAGFTTYARDNQRVAKWLAPFRRLDRSVA
ncbi:hypothetical protein [Micromonospora chokoriensis]